MAKTNTHRPRKTLGYSILNNGVRVVTDHKRDARTVLSGIWIGTGSRHEPMTQNGVSHCFEHNVYCGTENHTSFGLAARVEDRGGTYNAETGHDHTCYWMRAHAKDLPRIASVQADMLNRSTFGEANSKIELGRILREVSQMADSPETHIQDLIWKRAFPRQKLGRPILGDLKHLEKISRENLLKFRKRSMVGSNLVAVAIGNVNHHSFERITEEQYGALPRGTPPRRGTAKIRTGFMRVDNPDLSDTYISFGFPTAGFLARGSSVKDTLRQADATDCFGTLFCGLYTSGLYDKAARKSGIMYDTVPEHFPFAEVGLLTFHACVDSKRTDQFIEIVGNEVCRLKNNIGQKAFHRARERMKMDVIEKYEMGYEWACYQGLHTLRYGEPVSVDDRLKTLGSLSRSEVQAAAKQVLEHRPVVVAIGPQENVPNYARILEHLGFRRPVIVSSQNKTGTSIERLAA